MKSDRLAGVAEGEMNRMVANQRGSSSCLRAQTVRVFCFVRELRLVSSMSSVAGTGSEGDGVEDIGAGVVDGRMPR